MKVFRPTLLGAFAALGLATAAAAVAQDLRITAPSPAGGASDQLAQAIRSALTGDTKVVVSNVPGQGGTVGLAQFVSEASDQGLLVTGLTMVDAALMNRSSFPVDGLTPIARLSAEPFAVVVAAASPYRSVEELKHAVLADPARIIWGGGPVGGIEHVATALLSGAMTADPARLNFVSFLTAGEAAAALPDGQLSAAILPLAEVSADARSGRLRLLAVSSLHRLEGVDAPTLSEKGIPLELSNWRGVVARPGLGAKPRAALIGKVASLAQSPVWREALERRGWQSAYLEAEEFGAFIRQEQARVKGALRALGVLKRAPD